MTCPIDSGPHGPAGRVGHTALLVLGWAGTVGGCHDGPCLFGEAVLQRLQQFLVLAAQRAEQLGGALVVHLLGEDLSGPAGGQRPCRSGVLVLRVPQQLPRIGRAAAGQHAPHDPRPDRQRQHDRAHRTMRDEPRHVGCVAENPPGPQIVNPVLDALETDLHLRRLAFQHLPVRTRWRDRRIRPEPVQDRRVSLACVLQCRFQFLRHNCHAGS